jgi:hypothetical protein
MTNLRKTQKNKKSKRGGGFLDWLTGKKPEPVVPGEEVAEIKPEVVAPPAVVEPVNEEPEKDDVAKTSLIGGKKSKKRTNKKRSNRRRK